MVVEMFASYRKVMLHLELKISMKTQLNVIYVHVVEVCRPGYIRTYVRLPIQQVITKIP